MLGLRQNTNVLFGLTSYFIRKENIFNMFKNKNSEHLLLSFSYSKY